MNRIPTAAENDVLQVERRVSDRREVPPELLSFASLPVAVQQPEGMEEAVKIDESALNDAAWMFIDNAPRDSIPPTLWNNLKRALKPAIECYLSKINAMVPVAEHQEPDEQKLLDAAKAFAKEHIEGDALHDDDHTPDHALDASDERYNETKRLLCDAYLELAAAPVLLDQKP